MPLRFRRRCLRAAACAAIAVVGVTAAVQVPAAAVGPIRGLGGAAAIPGQYIVVYKDGSVAKSDVGRVSTGLASRFRASVTHEYSAAIRGFAAKMTQAQAARVAADPRVAYVEVDQSMRSNDVQTAPPSWGADRLDQSHLPLDRSYTYPTGGAGVTAYVLDSGIRTTHAEFGGRATWGTNTVGDGRNYDCFGHGTNVAATLGGATYGIAKKVALIAVKVLDCTGYSNTSGIIAGVDWVTQHHVSGPAVANMSLGGGSAASLDAAVRRSIADNITYVIAAGNDEVNACRISPARTQEAITVGAATENDARASFSNYGSCIDILAPGTNITSAWNSSDTASLRGSGTSSAAPHVAGAAAQILAASPTASPEQVWTTLRLNASKFVVSDARPGTPNNLLQVSGARVNRPTLCTRVSNDTDLPVPDNGVSRSAVTVSGCNRKGSQYSQVSVRVLHGLPGQLVVDLITPSGAAVNLVNRDAIGSNLDQTFVADLSGVQANGTWTLRVRDAVASEVGTIDVWRLAV